MIKASELRVGNWYKLNDMPILLTVKAFQDLIVFETWGRLAPVPLTQEILIESCNFIRDNSDIWGESYYNDEITIHKEGQGYVVFASEWTIGEPFYYLHELQNVYFCLYRQEIEINLNQRL